MPTLTEVRVQMKEGNRQQAAQLLKQVLKTKPSADAWYTAAQLSSKRETKIAHLNRALMYDATHRRAQAMLIDLGGKRGLKSLATDTSLKRDSRDTLTAILNNPTARLIATGVCTFVVVLMFKTMAAAFAGGATAPIVIEWTPVPRPDMRVVQAGSVENIIPALTQSGLTVSAHITDDNELPVAAQQMSLDINASNGYTYPAHVYLFPDSFSRSLDMGAITETYAEGWQFVPEGNVLLVYPANMPQPEAETLVRVLTNSLIA